MCFTKVFRTELGHKYILVECSVIALCLPVMSKLPVINSCAINRTMIGMSIKRISVLNLCQVLKPFVKSTPDMFGKELFIRFTASAFRKLLSVYCLADHGQTIQSLAKCGSCHCIFRLLQTFLSLFSWKMVVNLNNQSGSQYLTEWLLIYFSDEIIRFLYCKTSHRLQQPHKSANKIICAIISACYFALK